MSRTVDKVALDDWYAVGRLEDFSPGSRTLRLLGAEIVATRESAPVPTLRDETGAELPAVDRYGHVWTTLGQPKRPVFDLPEIEETDRRLVTCGAVSVRTSGLRIVENFLDLAHFPYVHTGILGVEEQAEVVRYSTEIREDVDEVWATKCQFYQPFAAKSATQGQITHYMYRVPSPFVCILYKTCPTEADRWDALGLFIQPVEPDRCLVHSFLLLIDMESRTEDLIQFQQTIFLQDRIILENQRPRLLPLDPRREIPTRADASSVAYRRWLKDRGLSFGILERVAA